MFTPSQVSDMLDIRPSTLRYYCARYSDLLSSLAAPQPGKRRRFTDQDINILRKIKYLTREKKTPDEIRNLVNIIEPETPKQDTALALLPTVNQALEQLGSRLAQIQDRLEQLESWLDTPWYKRIGRKPPRF